MPASLSDSAVLGSNTGFQGRVEAALCATCVAISTEGLNVVNHPPRLTLVHNILASPTQLTNYATMFSLTVATDTNVLSDATGAGTVVLTTGNIDARQALVTDAHINAALSAMFNAFCSLIVS